MLTTTRIKSYRSLKRQLLFGLLDAPKVDVGEWHAMDVSGNPMLVSQEMRYVNFRMDIPDNKFLLADKTECNYDWAEEHFQERISGHPLNPAPSHVRWPYAMANNSTHVDENEVFSHTYPERYWPKFANVEGTTAEGRQIFVPHVGIRYLYGDLEDLVKLMIRSPMTRQAYLPVWFPEDTGAIEGQRLPCTLGYHFLMRDGKVDVSYFMRSCDFVRHFDDDMYLTGRLLQFIVGKLREAGHDVRVGDMIVQISSLHIFQGDVAKLEAEKKAILDREEDEANGVAI